MARERGLSHALTGPQHRCQTAGMRYVPARDLRNDVSRVLRRVEAGEHLLVTVGGRPVAELVPLPARPPSMAWETFLEGSQEWGADASLAEDLASLLHD
jgi:prevent-host-death family protein